jgi:hypothetical protein
LENHTQVILAQLQARLEMHEASAGVVEGKAQFVLGATSIIVTLTAITLPAKITDPFAIVALFVAAVLYAVMFGFCLLALAPREYDYPISSEWDEVVSWREMGAEAFDDQILSEYGDCIQTNRAIVWRKAQAVRISFYLLAAIMICIVLAAAIQVA